MLPEPKSATANGTSTNADAKAGTRFALLCAAIARNAINWELRLAKLMAMKDVIGLNVEIRQQLAVGHCFPVSEPAVPVERNDLPQPAELAQPDEMMIFKLEPHESMLLDVNNVPTLSAHQVQVCPNTTTVAWVANFLASRINCVLALQQAGLANATAHERVEVCPEDVSIFLATNDSAIPLEAFRQETLQSVIARFEDRNLFIPFKLQYACCCR